MKRYNLQLLLLLLLIFSSCEKYISEFNIDQSTESRLQVYAFPSDADDYLVNVSMTKSVYNNLLPLDDVRVTCTTNGQADEVALLNIEEHHGLPIAIFKVHGQHKSGDEIRVKVECKGVPSAEATTRIPVTTEFEVLDISDTEMNKQHYRIFKVGFRDHATTDYYAFRVLSEKKPVSDDDGGYYDTNEVNNDIYDDGGHYYPGIVLYDYYQILTDREPLLNHYVDLNLDAWDELYKRIYCFSDAKIQSSDVTMHLYVESCYSDCTVQFFTLSEEFYKMLDRLNSQMNNELGATGLSQMYSTYNNVCGGFGCVAGYTMKSCNSPSPSHKGHVPPGALSPTVPLPPMGEFWDM